MSDESSNQGKDITMDDNQTLVQPEPAPQSGAEDYLNGYRIVRTISESSYGIVYKGEEKRSKRGVVIKIIRDARISVADRLHQAKDEIERLEHLNHPGIARLLQIGATSEGHLYQVSEYARGLAIDEYVKTHKLSLGDRFAIFLKVCDALTHSHQHCILHRDLRPSKIIVDGKSNPKILGLGITTITDWDVEYATAPMAANQLKEFLSFKCPEQLAGNLFRVDVRSDLYSLGVILYGLLTERMPYTLESGETKEIIKVIRNEWPRRPSTLRSSIRGDLEAILLKSLKKEPSARYQNVDAYSQDLKNYFDKRPVLAQNPGAFYEFRKLASRYRSRFISVAVMTLAIVSFGVHIHMTTRRADRLLLKHQEEGSALKAVQLVSARQLAEKYQHEAEQKLIDQRESQKDSLAHVVEIEESLSKAQNDNTALKNKAHLAESIAKTSQDMVRLFMDMFRIPDFTQKGIGVITAQAVLDNGLKRVTRQFQDRPVLQATLLNDLGIIYQYLGLHEKATGVFKTAFDLRSRQLGDTDQDTLEAVNNLAASLYAEKNYQEAEPLCRHLVQIATQTNGAENSKTLTAKNNLAMTLYAMGNLPEAEQLFRENMTIRGRILGISHPKTILSRFNLASVLFDQGAIDQAEPLFREIIETLPPAFPHRSRFLVDVKSRLGDCLTAMGKFDQAEGVLLKNYEELRNRLGKNHKKTQAALKRIISMYSAWGKEEQADQWRKRLHGKTGR